MLLEADTLLSAVPLIPASSGKSYLNMHEASIKHGDQRHIKSC